MIARHPLGFGQWLQALSYALSQPGEIAIVGNPEAANIQALLSVVRRGYQPFQLVALAASSAQSPVVLLLRDRGLLDGQATAYVCRSFSCQAPATELEALRAHRLTDLPPQRANTLFQCIHLFDDKPDLHDLRR